jgi:putative peptidoglycan lipid II flippase
MKLAIQLGILSSFNIGVGFLYQWYVFTQLGPGLETDALFAGMAIPQVVLAVVTGSLMHVLVPLLAGDSEKQLRCDAWGFTILVSGIFTILATALYLTAPWWVPLTVPGFGTASKVLTISLTRIQLLGMVFSAICSVQWAAYHARQQFLWAEFTPILASISGFILLVWALPRFGVIAAAWIATLRVGLQSLLLAPGMGKPMLPELNSPVMKEAWRRIRPLLLGTVYYKTEPVVDRFLLSWASSGSLSLFYLAQRLYSAVNQVCNKAIVAPLVPLLGKFHKSGNDFELLRVYKRKLVLMFLIGSAGLVVVGFFGQNLLTLLIGHGNVTLNNINELWWIMIWLGGSFLGGLSGQITSSTFYACGDTVTPTKLSMVSYTVYLPSKVASFFMWGVKGLAVSTSIYYMVNLLLQIYFLNRKQFS